MKTLKWTALFALIIFQVARADEGDAKIVAMTDPAHPGMLAWQVNYTRPVDAPNVSIELDYKFWDSKVDGDVPSEKKLCAIRYRHAPAELSFKVFLNAKQSLIVMGGTLIGGSVSTLDATFAVAKEPKRNSDGVFVLCQKSIDPKHPVEMGDTGEAAAWIELGITPQP